jgi:hypothetical protein
MRFQTLQDVLGLLQSTTFFQSVLAVCFLLQIIWIHIDAEREREKKNNRNDDDDTRCSCFSKSEITRPALLSIDLVDTQQEESSPFTT